jgi:hypothetical protein
VAEMTGNKTTNMHPRTSRNCKAEDARVCGRLRPSHSQQAGNANNSHARLSSNSMRES